MKINWGTGIAITLAIFLIGMITLVIISSSQNLNLVTPDYYPKGIDYQNQINKKTHTSELQESIQFSQDADFIYLNFPSIDSTLLPKGKVLVFRPADYRFDKVFAIQVNDSLHQIISKEGLFKGRCIIKAR